MNGRRRKGSLSDIAEDISSRHPGLVVREFQNRRPGATLIVEQLRAKRDRREYTWDYEPDGCVRISGPGREFRSIFVRPPGLGAARLAPAARKKVLKDLRAVAETELLARSGWDRASAPGFAADDLVDANFGMVEGEPYFFLKFPDGRLIAVKSSDLNRREAEELLYWAIEELRQEEGGASMGDAGEVPRPEMWSAESVVRAVKEGFTFLLPFVEKRSLADPNAYWIGDVQYVAFGLTVGPEHTPEIGIRPDGWIWAHTFFTPEMVSNPGSRRAWVSDRPNEHGVVEVLIWIDPETIDWELLNRGTQVRVRR